MKRSDDRILTTHVGSLARSHQLLDAMKAKENGELPAEQFDALVASAVDEVVRHQAQIGIDVITDGEQGKLSFLQYLSDRLDGFETRPGRLPLAASWKLEIDMFPEYYEQYMQKYSASAGPSGSNLMVCVGPLSYRGQEAVQRDIANLKEAMANVEAVEAFMPAACPMGLGSTSTTRPRTSTWRRWPRRCARSTSRSSTPG